MAIKRSQAYIPLVDHGVGWKHERSLDTWRYHPEYFKINS